MVFPIPVRCHLYIESGPRLLPKNNLAIVDSVGGCLRYNGPWFNIKMLSYQYRKSHCGDKTVVRSSYLHNGISYTGKMTSLYWIRAHVLFWHIRPAPWRLKSPASPLFTQSFIQVQIKENIKAPRHWPLRGNWPVTDEFPVQMASNAQNASIWWRHHLKHITYICNFRHFLPLRRYS